MCQKRKNRTSELRKKLFDLKIHAIIIPSADPHQSEYLADHWKLREWLSGFTGSAGTLVVTREMAGLWTDSRYFLQAEEELKDSEIELFRQGNKNVPSISKFLTTSLSSGERVALNARMWSHQAVSKMTKEFQDHNLKVLLDCAPGEDLWNNNDRPKLPTKKIFIHSSKYVGSSVRSKLEQVRSEMSSLEVAHHLITTLDDIAWLFNVRGYDIAFNPVFLAYAVINQKDAHLFIDRIKLSDTVIDHLEDAGVLIHEYSEVDSYLSKLSKKTLLNPEDCNEELYSKISKPLIVEGKTITRLLKACKNSVEISHIEDVMIKDGIALAHAFYELYHSLKDHPITEAQFAEKLTKYRSEQPGYYGESFPAIIGYQANGAIVHYRPPASGSSIIKPEGLLLCDSGGQYFDGTTDITRTIAVGPTTREQKECYTRVLKGHIAIDTAVFPEGTNGGMLDILARQFLWKEGLNFGHGTGHGVGYFLNVHEPPQGISPGNGSRAITAFLPGMLTSNEPGYYKDGAFGIRIENLILTEKSEHEGYLKHRNVTLFPIDTSIILNKLMTREEIEWINDYHKKVAEKLMPHLNDPVGTWIRNACLPI